MSFRKLLVSLWLALSLLPVAHALDRTQLAVIVNTLDPLSVQIGDYYAAKRRIPFQNLIKVSFAPSRSNLNRSQFEEIKLQVDRQSRRNIQAYALTWVSPYRVDCMSITTAFAFGFDTAFCAEPCKLTRVSPYFNSPARLPFTQLGIRPTMSIAAASFDGAKALIDRGVLSDGTFPNGTAYLLSTSETARNVRSQTYPLIGALFNKRLNIRRLDQDTLRDKSDVLFYFTGRTYVEGLETLHFVPGAIADHLTSAGGVLARGGQMSALRWLEAGATASYGTVIEPCNALQKFPHPAVVIGHYLEGETVIESYWKSVNMPGQGIFIGEPLASPFAPVGGSR